MTPDEAVRIYQDKRASMNQEQMHGRPPFSEYEKCRAGMVAVLAEVDKDYVSRKGSIKQEVPREAHGMKAKIITLCGSTRFKEQIHAANARLTMAGDLVISLGVFGHLDMPDHDWTTGGNADKRMLDDLHKQKIDLADEIYVINVGGYVGDSTRGEIEYAQAAGKPVRHLEPIA